MKLIKQYLLLMLVCLSLLTYVIALQSDIPTELAVLAASGLTLVLAWVLERKLPYRKEWGESQGDLSVDLASAGVIIGLVDPLLKAVAPLAVVAMYASAGVGPLLLKQPLWLEIIFVLLAVEFGKYWAHRLHHQLGALWWLHAMHHSSERLYFLNGLRFHPLNYTLNFVIAVLPVMLLGVSPEALIAYLAITQPVVLLQHANIDLRHGWLNRVFSTPEVHRWHHSTVPEEANRNYGNALLIWDHVFGTFKPADGFDETRAIGLFTSSKSHYPGRSGYIAQLASMLKWPCCRT